MERSKTMCGDTGVSTTQSRRGNTMGPRAENEYAVDPVGVATMTPSAENVVTLSPSTQQASVTNRCRECFSTMTSLRAHCGSGSHSAGPSGSASARIAIRSSM